MIVENKPGAGTALASNFVAKAPPDGYTLLMAISALTTAPYYVSNSGYDPPKDFEPVSLVAKVVHLLVVDANLPVESVPDLIMYAKARPKRVSFGSAGPGTSSHLEGELFRSLTKTDLLHVPYKGNAPALTDLIRGELSMMFDARESVLPYIESGKLRALAVTSTERLPLMPQSPTVAEAGVPGFVAFPWTGVLAPAGTPKAIVAKLNRAISEVAKDPVFQDRLHSMGFTIAVGPSDEFRQFIEQEAAKWAKLIEQLKPEKQ
jgi:tripartite-type tricarboxylate transporter receptor subunit TctC